MLKDAVFARKRKAYFDVLVVCLYVMGINIFHKNTMYNKSFLKICLEHIKTLEPVEAKRLSL